MKELQGLMKEAHKLMLELDFPVRIDDGGGGEIQFLTVGTKTENFLLQTRFTVREEEKEIYSITQIPFKIPEDMIPTAYVVLNEINSKVAIGCFFISLDLRCIFFRACIPFFGTLTSEIIETLTGIVAGTVDKRMQKFGQKFLFDKSFSTTETLKSLKKSDSSVWPTPLRPSGVTLH